jgi:hypothetical protein
MIGAKSSNSLRMNWRCTGRHMGGLRNGHNPAINDGFPRSSTAQPCGTTMGSHTCGETTSLLTRTP